MSDRVWGFIDDLLEAAGGIPGVVLGFLLPLVAMGLAVYSIVTQ